MGNRGNSQLCSGRFSDLPLLLSARKRSHCFAHNYRNFAPVKIESAGINHHQPNCPSKTRKGLYWQVLTLCEAKPRREGMNIELRRFAVIATFLIVSVSWSLAQESSPPAGAQGNSTTPSTQQQNPTTPAPQPDSTTGNTQEKSTQENPPAANTQEQSMTASDSKASGKVYVSVLPDEAYIWVDGKPATHRTSSLTLPAGEHTITVYNYGFAPKTQTVAIKGGESQELTAHLEPVPGTVTGPWGRIQIEGVPGNSLVFMNGTTPEFFVGHADEMNNNFMNKQQLIVPVGTHQLTVVRRKTNEPIWSGKLEVKEDKRLILYVKGQDKAHIVYKDWSKGKKIKDLKRFEAGTATATIAVAPVTATLVVDHPDIKCNQPVKLTWSSKEGTVTTVSANNEKLAQSASGDLTVQPKQTTQYEFRAAGPGGTVVKQANVNVDPTVQASLSSSTQEVRFVKVGDTIQDQGTADLQWNVSNADTVQIDPVGSVSGNSGTQSVQVAPSQTNEGPVDETKTYKLTATNVCGGSETKTVAVHVTGSIAPEQVAQAEPPPEPEPSPEQKLPATASPMPLLAAFGLVSLASGLLFKFRKK
jgi:LPXTG-motif cell wall-anchored protein